jgi:hypothetical protein
MLFTLTYILQTPEDEVVVLIKEAVNKIVSWFIFHYKNSFSHRLTSYLTELNLILFAAPKTINLRGLHQKDAGGCKRNWCDSIKFAQNPSITTTLEYACHQ